jgi:hypothetical protein
MPLFHQVGQPDDHTQLLPENPDPERFTEVGLDPVEPMNGPYVAPAEEPAPPAPPAPVASAAPAGPAPLAETPAAPPAPADQPKE